MRQFARYTVIIDREIGDEDGQNYLGVTDEASAIQQLRKELQAAYDHPAAAPAGTFNIAERKLMTSQP